MAKGQHEEALKEPNAADCILNGSLFMKEFLIWGPQMGFKDQQNPLNHKENYIYIYILSLIRLLREFDVS